MGLALRPIVGAQTLAPTTKPIRWQTRLGDAASTAAGAIQAAVQDETALTNELRTVREGDADRVAVLRLAALFGHADGAEWDFRRAGYTRTATLRLLRRACDQVGARVAVDCSQGAGRRADLALVESVIDACNSAWIGCVWQPDADSSLDGAVEQIESLGGRIALLEIPDSPTMRGDAPRRILSALTRVNLNGWCRVPTVLADVWLGEANQLDLRAESAT